MDPVTGDHLSRGEYASWVIQRTIRRWWFFGVTQAMTAFCWWYGRTHPDWLTWWNLSASDFAIIMEFLLTIAVLGQALRDAVVARRVRAMEEQNLRMEREHGLLLRAQGLEIAALRAQVAELHAVIVGGATVRVRGADGRFVASGSVREKKAV